jgi:hypothetical protein
MAGLGSNQAAKLWARHGPRRPRMAHGSVTGVMPGFFVYWGALALAYAVLRVSGVTFQAGLTGVDGPGRMGDSQHTRQREQEQGPFQRCNPEAQADTRGLNRSHQPRRLRAWGWRPGRARGV